MVPWPDAGGRPMRIRSLDRPTPLPARMADILVAEISSGRLRPGDRLPTEQYLAANFGVSRNVVREAIAQLRSAGLVSSRQGVGTIVVQTGGAGVAMQPATTAVAADDTQHFRHVYEVRTLIESKAAALAACNGDAAQFSAITHTLERMQEAAQWAAEGVDLDVDFHLAVAQASGNPLIADLLTVLKERMRETIAATRRRSGGVVGEVRQLTIDEHTAIRDAIVARNPGAAQAAMARHITNAAHRLGYPLPRDTGLDT